jgi:hypothetical protein
MGPQNVKVAVRCRPLSSKEEGCGEETCISFESGNVCCIRSSDAGGPEHRFAFDLCLGPESSQSTLWDEIGSPVLENAVQGYNGTIFAYGQTGSGKTHSMTGPNESQEFAGIIPRMTWALWERIAREGAADDELAYLVQCSYLEIYQEVVYDLLDPDNRSKKGVGLEVREHPALGIYVKGLREIVVDSPQKMFRLMQQGLASRRVGTTAMNDSSSRSHSVFTIKVHRRKINASSGQATSTFASVNLVDLAGSERQRSTGAVGLRLQEGANINKSLSALGNVINALVDVSKGKRGVFVPYRNSKLTRVLQESLGGNSITAMLAAVSPAASSMDETLSTLRYASRAKAIKLNAHKNEEASQISRLEDEIKLLKAKLRAQEEGQLPDAGGEGGHEAELEQRYSQQLADMEAALRSTWEMKVKQSDDVEQERMRLQQRLEEESRRREMEREKRWQRLEEKGDLELSIRELQEIVPNLPAGEWIASLRLVQASEHTVAKLSTVCNVYAEALAEDMRSILASSRAGGGPGDDSSSQGDDAITSEPEASIGYWASSARQLLTKLSSLHDVRLQLERAHEEVHQQGKCLCKLVTTWHDPQPESSCSEVTRALTLLTHQVAAKNAPALRKETFTGMKSMMDTIELVVKTLRHSTLGMTKHFQDAHRLQTELSHLGQYLLSQKLVASECIFQHANGHISTTEHMCGVAGVNWTHLLRNTPPSKLLERPPVRFMYDLIKAVCDVTGFGTPELRARLEGQAPKGKRDKLEIMDMTIELVVQALKLEQRPAKGENIIVGKCADETNRFLQLLVLASSGSASRDLPPSKDAYNTFTSSILLRLGNVLQHLTQLFAAVKRTAAVQRRRLSSQMTDQLTTLQNQLAQANKNRLRIEDEKRKLEERAVDRDEELLSAKAALQQERVEKEALVQALARSEEELLKVRLIEAERAEHTFATEKEDLLSQVAVLTEERNLARAQEEDLWERLADKTEDLEALQESYVTLTDHWNSLQDEHTELMEQNQKFTAQAHRVTAPVFSALPPANPPTRGKLDADDDVYGEDWEVEEEVQHVYMPTSKRNTPRPQSAARRGRRYSLNLQHLQ